jgi:hypothetical protein
LLRIDQEAVDVWNGIKRKKRKKNPPLKDTNIVGHTPSVKRRSKKMEENTEEEK